MRRHFFEKLFWVVVPLALAALGTCATTVQLDLRANAVEHVELRGNAKVLQAVLERVERQLDRLEKTQK